MPANPYKGRPASKTYRAANGHLMELAYRFSRHTGWYPVHSLSTHSAECECDSYDVSEYAGESE
jgi:hypothetical protein